MEEGQERVDQDGEMALPNDEELGDLNNVEVSDDGDEKPAEGAPALAEGELELED